jgi:5-formyltetrahydrofolate cyclo-ligase
MADSVKQKLRERVLARRKALTVEQRSKGEQAITAKLLNVIANLVTDKDRQFVALYHARGSELGTAALATAFKANGYQLVYPQVLGDGLMEFAQEIDLEDAARTATQVIAAQIVVMIVPLVAFDAQCNRLGMGGGYYDRYLPRLSPLTKTLGIAFDEQLVENLPLEPHDSPLSAIITPRACYEACHPGLEPGSSSCADSAFC